MTDYFVITDWASFQAILTLVESSQPRDSITPSAAFSAHGSIAFVTQVDFICLLKFNDLTFGINYFVPTDQWPITTLTN